MIGNWGGVSFPLNAADFTTTFAAADPARQTLMALLRAAISAELATVWPVVVATLPSGHALRGSSVVQDSIELPPSRDVMEQRKAGFPLLALHRAEKRTYTPIGNDRQRSQPWHLHYILGPLEVGSARKLHDVCLLVEAIVDMVVNRGYHEAYEGGAQQFGAGSPFNRIQVTQAEGPAQSLYGGDENSGTIYWALVITIDTTESGSSTTDADGETGDPLLDGASYDVAAKSADGSFPSMVLADTDPVLE
jgi:hypothetical protein